LYIKITPLGKNSMKVTPNSISDLATSTIMKTTSK
jgi:hypothetical protein